MSAPYLLKLLDSAPAQSLDSLALVLGVDPVLAGDWLAQLSEQGFAIQTDDRGALSLLRSVDWLQAQRIASRSASVEILLSTTSTSDELLGARSDRVNSWAGRVRRAPKRRAEVDWDDSG